MMLSFDWLTCYRERMVLPLWRGIASLNLMLPKEERKALLYRLYDDTEELQDSSQRHPSTTKDGEESAPKEDQAAVDQGNEAMAIAEETQAKSENKLEQDDIKEMAAAPERQGESDLLHKEGDTG